MVGLGAICIDGIYLTAFAIGFGAFLKSEIARQALFLLGGGLLLWLGALALRDAWKVRLPSDDGPDADSPKSPLYQHFLTGLALTGSSPYTIIFWSAFALEFAGLGLWKGTLACLAMMAGCYSWVLTLTFLTTGLRKVAGRRFFVAVTLLGGLFLAGFGIRFWLRAMGL